MEAIEELAIYLADFSISEQDNSVLLRYFSFGLHRLKSYHVRFEQEKMPYLYPIDEAIGLLNNEIRLVEWRIKYPEQFKSHFNKQPFSPLYLADKTNLIDIMEIISGLFLSKHIVYKNDKPTFCPTCLKLQAHNLCLLPFSFFYFFVHCTEQGTHFRLFSEYPFQEKFCLQNEEQDVHCS